MDEHRAYCAGTFYIVAGLPRVTKLYKVSRPINVCSQPQICTLRTIAVYYNHKSGEFIGNYARTLLNISVLRHVIDGLEIPSLLTFGSVLRNTAHNNTEKQGS